MASVKLRGAILLLLTTPCQLAFRPARHPVSPPGIVSARAHPPAMQLVLKRSSFGGEDEPPNDGFFPGDEPSWQQKMPSALQATTSRDPYRIALRVLPLVLLHSFWASCVVLMRIASGYVWSCVPLLHTLTGGVLGLLLAFRTNQAYQRYWSACGAWAKIHQTTHNLARQASMHFLSLPRDTRRSFAYPSFIRHLVALPISLKQRVRGLADPEELWSVLPRADVSAMVAAQTPHLFLLSALSCLALPLRSGDDGSGKGLALWGELERGLSELQSAACQLDLVSRLPPPASYSVHTARFLALWMYAAAAQGTRTVMILLLLRLCVCAC